MTVPVAPLQAGAIDQILNSLVRFFPRAFWSTLVLVVGVGVAILVSGRAESAVRDSAFVADSLAGPFAYGVKVLLYFFAVTIALSELGLNTSVLVVFLDGVAFGLGVAVALAVGIAVGWGSREYVADHVEEWVQDVVASESEGAGDDETGEGATASDETNESAGDDETGEGATASDETNESAGDDGGAGADEGAGADGGAGADEGAGDGESTDDDGE